MNQSCPLTRSLDSTFLFFFLLSEQLKFSMHRKAKTSPPKLYRLIVFSLCLKTQLSCIVLLPCNGLFALKSHSDAILMGSRQHRNETSSSFIHQATCAVWMLTFSCKPKTVKRNRRRIGPRVLLFFSCLHSCVGLLRPIERLEIPCKLFALSKQLPFLFY